MAKNVVGLFDTMNDAEAAVRDLRDAGFNSNDISFVGNNADKRYNLDNTSYDTTTSNSEAEEGAGLGATGGAVLGGLAGLLVGLGALAIPGIGPVVAAGTLATALGSTALGAGLGAAAGGLVGALVGAGIPENDANVYAEGIRRGGALLSVQVATDDDADRAASIMDRHNVVDIDERGGTYRESGWSRFDESSEPYSTTSGSYASTGYGDADRNIGSDDYDRSSKVGTAGGGLAGAATGAAIGSAGGPVGAVVGGVAGAVTGGAIGAAGDAAGAEATDNDADRTGYDTTNRAGTAYGSATTNYDTTRTDYTTTNTGMSSTNLDQGGEVKIPIVEEELRVGKREVEQGGVRVNTRVEETPVNEQVTLREETVDVHRKPVDRPVSDADVANFQEGTFEVRERAEEAIVDKQARVVEEVHIKKDVEERTENIQDTVRRTDVDVDQIGGQRTVGSTDVNYTDTSYTGTTGTTGYNTTGTTDEGAIERGASKLGNAAERTTGADIDRDGDVGQRDPRNNY
ncbi:MAG TPA: YsnF/AvaK domain-containing protein [Herpetosiphonaceae bacterium]